MWNSESVPQDDQGSLAESTQEFSIDSSDHHPNENSLGAMSSLRSNPIQNGKVPKPDDERKLFVGQLSSDITKEDLENYFSQFGTIENVTIKYDVPGGRARGFAFILFDEKDSIDKVLRVPKHVLHQCQLDPKQAHRRPPVTNPVKKIFIGQLPTNFVEEDLTNYFSQFGLVDSIELPMDREKNMRRSFGFVSFSSEKTAEEVLRQQRHSINGTWIEVRPAKPRPHEQQQHQHYQNSRMFPYGEYLVPAHRNSMMHQQNFSGQIVDQWSQVGNNPLNAQWSNENNPGFTSVDGNANLYGSLATYEHNAVYNPNGTNSQISYPVSSSHQSGNHLYSTGYSRSSNDFQSSVTATTATPSWNQFNPVLNGATTASTTNQYESTMYYPSAYYPNIPTHAFYPISQQAQYGINASQGNISVDGTSSMHVITDKNYQQHAMR